MMAGRPAPCPLPLRADIARHVVQLRLPAAAVHAERFQAPLRGHLVEARFDHLEQRGAAGRVVQREGDQGRLLLAVVDCRVDRVWIPAPGHQVLRFDALDDGIEEHVFVATMRNLPAHALAGGEGLALQAGAEPGAKLVGVGEGQPHPLARGVDDDAAFDAVGVGRGVHGVIAPWFEQPIGCMNRV